MPSGWLNQVTCSEVVSCTLAEIAKAAMRDEDLAALMIKEAELVDRGSFKDPDAAIGRTIPIRSDHQAT